MMIFKGIKRSHNAFTLVELLVALVVTSIILTAVAALAFAVGTANDTSDDTSRKQAQIRYTTLKISELIRHSKLICSTHSNDLAVWRADDNNDEQININELVYIEIGSGHNHLQLCEFSSSDNPVINLGSIQELGTNWWLAYNSEITYIPLIPECSNVQFNFDVLPPQSKFVSILFDVLEGNTVHQYQISAGLRGWAGNLLNQTGVGLISDDD